MSDNFVIASQDCIFGSTTPSTVTLLACVTLHAFALPFILAVHVICNVRACVALMSFSALISFRLFVSGSHFHFSLQLHDVL